MLHSILRFLIDFTKEGGTYIYGLKIIQWVLLLVIPVVIIFIFRREKSWKDGYTYIFEERPVLFNLLLYLPTLLILALPKDWLTTAEFRVLLIMNIIVSGIFIYSGIKYLCHRYKFFVRIPIVIASIAILETSLDTTIINDILKSVYFIEVGGGYMNGVYHEICGDKVPYNAGGINAGIYFKDKSRTIYGAYLKGFAIETNSDLDYCLAGNLIINHRYFGLDFGAGRVLHPYSEIAYPSLGMRLGPREKAFIDGEFLKHRPADSPSPFIKFGVGFGTGSLKNETIYRFGVSDAGFYVNPDIYLFDNRLRISPFFSTGGRGVYQINLYLGYRYHFKN